MDKQIGDLIKEFVPQTPDFSLANNANSTQTFTTSTKSVSHAKNDTFLSLNSTLAYENITYITLPGNSSNSSVVFFSYSNTTSLNSNIPSSSAKSLLENKEFLFFFNLFSFVILIKNF